MADPGRALLELLQSQAPTIMPRRDEEDRRSFLIYWTKLCLRAGIDLWAKASLPSSSSYGEASPMARINLHQQSDNLSMKELFQVMLYLEIEYGKLVQRWQAYIYSKEE